jgi:hypothetical protein
MIENSKKKDKLFQVKKEESEHDSPPLTVTLGTPQSIGHTTTVQPFKIPSESVSMIE